MTEQDQQNLHFLLTASPETLKDWYSKVDHDDHIYAKRLLDQYQQELDEALVEAKLKSDDGEYEEANTILAKYMK